MRRKCCSARFNGKLRHMHKTSPPTLMRGKPYLWLIFGQDPFSSESIRPLSQTQQSQPGILPDAIRENMDRMLRPSWDFACSRPGPNRVGVVEFFVEGKFSRPATARYSFRTGSYCPLVAELAGSGCVCSHSARAEAVGSMPTFCHQAASPPRRCSSR